MRAKSSSQDHLVRVNRRRILVPVDFSDCLRVRSRHAAKRAVESGGSLIIIYVVPADYGWLGIGRDELRDLDCSLQRQAADRLRTFVDENVGHKVPADLEDVLVSRQRKSFRRHEIQNAIQLCSRRAASLAWIDT